MIVFYFAATDAFVQYQTDAPVIAVKAWERGFYPIRTRATPAELNECRAWSPEVLEAALIASMFGWNVPAARAAVEAVLAVEKAEAIEAASRPPDYVAPRDLTDAIEEVLNRDRIA